MSLGPDDEVAKNLVVERFKSVLAEKERLNREVEVYLRIFLATAIGAAGISSSSFLGGGDSINSVPSRDLVDLMISLTCLAGAFLGLLVLINIFSWFDLRYEESQIMNKFSPGERSQPKLRNFWRWRETYVLMFIWIVTAAIWLLRTSILAAFGVA